MMTDPVCGMNVDETKALHDWELIASAQDQVVEALTMEEKRQNHI